MKVKFLLTLCLIQSSLVVGDYDCMCNYNVEQGVFPSPDPSGQPLGYMYEFDCKPTTQIQQNSDKFYTIQFEKQIGYVPESQQIRLQTCPGQPSSTDLIPQTTSAAVTTSTTTTTTSTTTPKPTTITTTGKMTTSTTTPTPTTSTTTPIPTTPTTTPIQTTRTTTPIPTTHTTTPIPTTPTTTPIQTTPTSKPIPTTPTTTTIPTTPTTTPIPTTPTTTTTTTTTRITTPFVYWSLAANVTGTPYQYIGAGYNLLTGNPGVTRDPGFLTSQRIFQLTGNSSNVREVVYDKHSTCNRKTYTAMLHGSKAYQDELKTSVKPSATHPINLSDKAFTHTDQFESMRQTLDQSSQIVFIDKTTTCSYGTVQYLTENVTTGHFSVTREFAKDVCSLPAVMTTSGVVNYMQFLDKWGTSIVTRVDLGTKTVDRYQTTPVQIYQHVQQTDFNLLRQDGAFEGFSSSVSINTHDYPNSKAGMSSIGTHRTTSMGSVLHQIPISADLISISDALNLAYWKPIADELVKEGICPDSILSTGMSQYFANMKSALQQYPAYKDSQTTHKYLHTLIDRPVVQVPITWPFGTYGLMKATNGCPGDNTRWQEGWRKFDTEDTFSSHNSFSSGIQHYLAGDFHSNDITTRFCMKTTGHSITGGQYDQQWPRGSYCLLKKGSCPSGFSSGSIFWDDEDISNHNAAGGILPDGKYDKNTNMFFCCRNDGSSSTKLLLPTDHTFVLIKYRQSCQSVFGMSVHEVYVRWDDENTFNKDKSSGAHPLDDGGSKDHKIHFCIYQKQSGPGIIG